jgi:pimeloyl-ACP methyl ester carboxylesterase
MAKSNDYKRLIVDTAEKSYTGKHLNRMRLLYPVIGRIGKPKDFSRFLIQADACIRHDAYDKLEKMQCPVLVIGGDSDKVVGADASAEIARRIPGGKLVLYKGLGHAAYEEAKDFHDQVLAFLTAPAE